MKNNLKITVVAALTLIATASFGQSLNIKAGYTMSTIKFESSWLAESESTNTFNGTTSTSSTKIKYVGGFNAGIGYEFKLGERFSLETGFNYLTRGYKIVSEHSIESATYSSQETSTYKYKLNYIDLPIVLNTAILTGDFRLYVRTGIYAGFMLGGKYSSRNEFSSSEGENGVYESSEIISNDDFDTGDRVTGGFVLGLGAEYKGVYFEANYNLGPFSLTDIDDNTSARSLSFSLGYKFKFNK